MVLFVHSGLAMLRRILIGAHSVVGWPYLCIVVYDSDSGSSSAQHVMLLVQISIMPLSPLKIEEEGM